jgi:hypothetical protein
MPLSLQSDNIFESYNPDIKDSLNTILDSVSKLEKIAKERKLTAKKANNEATNAQNNVQVAMDTINEVVKITDNAEDQIVDSLKSLTSSISSEPAPVNLQDSILKPPIVDTPVVDIPSVDTTFVDTPVVDEPEPVIVIDSEPAPVNLQDSILKPTIVDTPAVDTTFVDTPVVDEPEPVIVIDSEPAPVGTSMMITEPDNVQLQESKPVVPVEIEDKEEKLNDYIQSPNLGTNVPEYVIPDGLMNDTDVANIEGFSKFTTPSILLAISFIILIVLGIVLYNQNNDSIPDFELSDTPFI